MQIGWHRLRNWGAKILVLHSSLKIFILDDDKFNLAWYTKFVASLGEFEVEAFDDAQDCLGRMHEKPDILMLDQHLGNTSGLEVLRRIKQNREKTRVVFVSGQDDSKISSMAIDAGAEAYIVKGPGDLDKINQVLKSLKKIIIGELNG